MDMHTSLFAWYYLRRGATRGQFDVFFKEVEHAYPEARMLLVDEPGLSLRNVGEIHEHTHVLEGQRDMMVYYSSDPTAFREEHHGRSHLDFDGHAEFAVSVWEPPGDLDVRAADRRRVVTVATFGGTWTAMEESRVLSMRMTELFLLLGSTLGARAGLFRHRNAPTMHDISLLDMRLVRDIMSESPQCWTTMYLDTGLLAEVWPRGPTDWASFVVRDKHAKGALVSRTTKPFSCDLKDNRKDRTYLRTVLPRVLGRVEEGLPQAARAA
jgi:hypothetical protein